MYQHLRDTHHLFHRCHLCSEFFGTIQELLRHTEQHSIASVDVSFPVIDPSIGELASEPVSTSNVVIGKDISVSIAEISTDEFSNESNLEVSIEGDPAPLPDGPGVHDFQQEFLDFLVDQEFSVPGKYYLFIYVIKLRLFKYSTYVFSIQFICNWLCILSISFLD